MLVQDFIDSMWGSQDLNPGSLTARAHPLNHPKDLLVTRISIDFSVIICSVQLESSSRLTKIGQVANSLDSPPGNAFQ